MRINRFRNLGALVFLFSVMLATPAKAQNCGVFYDQGGCGCSGWLTIDFPGHTESWCNNSDLEGCAEEACNWANCGSSVGYIEPSCSNNQYSAWYGVKCNLDPCEGR